MAAVWKYFCKLSIEKSVNKLRIQPSTTIEDLTDNLFD